MNAVVAHYAIGDLTSKIAAALQAAGKDLARITAEDLAPIDEFHIRGRSATLELGARMGLTSRYHVLDVGSGLGGPARTLAATYSCRVTGFDISEEFCATANTLSNWLGMSDRVAFLQGDATALNVSGDSFDAAISLHAGMNIAAKDVMFEGVFKALKPGGIFAVYDILQGEGGEVLFPVPWARDVLTSHLVTQNEMRDLLHGAGFQLVREDDSTTEAEEWFKRSASQMADMNRPPFSFRQFLGEDAGRMAQNQVKNLSDRRIRTATFICRKPRT
jgi:ubiquinone/menaquinone biosynthesis C-methylase UbiE